MKRADFSSCSLLYFFILHQQIRTTNNLVLTCFAAAVSEEFLIFYKALVSTVSSGRQRPSFFIGFFLRSLTTLLTHQERPQKEKQSWQILLMKYTVFASGEDGVFVFWPCVPSLAAPFYGQNVIYNGCVSERTPARFSFLITLCNERGLGKLFRGPGFSMGIRGRNHI